MVVHYFVDKLLFILDRWTSLDRTLFQLSQKELYSLCQCCRFKPAYGCIVVGRHRFHIVIQTVDALHTRLCYFTLSASFLHLFFTLLTQWSNQVIGIGWAPIVRLTIALTTLALAPTYHEQDDERWPGTCPARPGLRYATVLTQEQSPSLAIACKATSHAHRGPRVKGQMQIVSRLSCVQAWLCKSDWINKSESVHDCCLLKNNTFSVHSNHIQDIAPLKG